MIENILLVVGAGILCLACRSFNHPLLHRIGTFGILGTSFLAGWLIGGSVWIGLSLAVMWLFLPWLEILTRVRQLRMPAERQLESRTPPPKSVFPDLNELTDEVEALGFEHVRDAGWDDENGRLFFRIFNDAEGKNQAAICLAEQDSIAFYYLTISSRLDGERSIMTWNYPFSYGLQLPPSVMLHRLNGQPSFPEMLQAHGEFLKSQHITSGMLLPQTAENVIEAMQADIRKQVAHNIKIGVLCREDGGQMRYTNRGLFYLWLQFLRDFVRLS